MSDSTQKIVEAWIKWRKAAFGDIKDQIRPMMVASQQDDFTAAVISEEVAAWLEEWVVGKLTGELGIKLSQKEVASQPLAEILSAIGATLDLRVGSTMVRPNSSVVEKLRGKVSD